MSLGVIRYHFRFSGSQVSAGVIRGDQVSADVLRYQRFSVVLR